MRSIAGHDWIGCFATEFSVPGRFNAGGWGRSGRRARWGRHVELAFLADEGWGNAMEYPDVCVCGLLAYDGCDRSCDAADFDVKNELDGFVAKASDGKRGLADMLDC